MNSTKIEKCHRKHRIAIAIVVIVALCQDADATPITFEIGGSLTYAVGGGSIGVGTPFTAQFTYDPTTPDSDGDPDFGSYRHPTPLGENGIVVEIGSFSYDLTQSSHWEVFTRFVTSSGRGDAFSILFLDDNATLPSFPSVTFLQGEIQLRGPDGLFGGDDSLPTSLTLSDFNEVRRFAITGYTPSGTGGYTTVFNFTGEIDTLGPVSNSSSAGAVIDVDYDLTQGGGSRLFMTNEDGLRRYFQTFRPGLTGELGQIDLSLSREGRRDAGSLRVDVYSTNSGVPDQLLATSTLDTDIVTTGYGGEFVEVDFRTSLPSLLAEELYAIVLTPADTTRFDGVMWQFGDTFSSTEYRDGFGGGSADGGSTWFFMNNGSTDFNFRTYMIVAVPEPQAMALAALAVLPLGLLAYRRRKRA